MADNQDGAQTIWRPSNIADSATNAKHILYRTKSYRLTTDEAQDNTYTNIRAKTPIKALLIKKCLFPEDSKTVLKDVIYGNPKQIRKTK